VLIRLIFAVPEISKPGRALLLGPEFDRLVELVFIHKKPGSLPPFLPDTKGKKSGFPHPSSVEESILG